LDGWFFPVDNDLYPRVTQPALFVNAQKWQWTENLKRIMKYENCLEKNIFTFK
jgi:hypothetical protein